MLQFLKNMTGQNKVEKSLVLLLLIGGLYALSIALSNTFVNIFLWKQSGKFIDIALYNLFTVLFQVLTFLIAGKIAKKYDRVIVLRLGVIFLSIFYITVLLVGEEASNFIFLLGALLGIGYGFYWLAFNVLTFEITEPNTRDFFNGYSGLLTSFAGMIGPILAGFIIFNMNANSGYTVIFSLSLGLFSIAVILSMMLKRRAASGEFAIKEIFDERHNNKNWRNILFAHFFQGLREGSFLFIISVWVFVTTKSEMALGTYGLLHSGIALIIYFLATKYIKGHLRNKAILIGGILLYGSVFLLLFNLTYTSLLIYAVIIAIAYPILLVPYHSITYDVIGKSKDAGNKRIEYIIVREVFLNSGRISSILLFIFAITFFNEEKSIPILLLIIGTGHLWIYFFVKGIKNKETEGNKNTHVFKNKLITD